jgi:hypothetical protein
MSVVFDGEEQTRVCFILNYKNCISYASEGYKPFVKCSIRFQNSKEENTVYYALISVLKMEVTYSSETFVPPTRLRGQNSDHNISLRHENLKLYIRKLK